MRRVGFCVLAVVLNLAGCGEHNREAVENNNQGMRLLRAGRFADARERFQRAAEMDPRYDVPLSNLALAYARQRDWANAADALNRAIARNPNNAEFHQRLGEAHYQIAMIPENQENGQGGPHLEQARTAYQAAIQRNRNLYYAHFRLGQIAEALDNPQDGLRAYTDALTLAPRAYAAYTRLARLYIQHRFFQESAQVLREGLRITPGGAPERGMMHNFLGEAIRLQRPDDAGQRAQAAEEYRQAVEEDPTLHDALYNLAMAYAEMPDRRPQAIHYLNQFISQRDPNLPREYYDQAQSRLAELQGTATPPP